MPRGICFLSNENGTRPLPCRGQFRGFFINTLPGDARLMNARTKKFFSYYKPYLRTFIMLMACAFLVAAITLALPLLTRYITKDILESGMQNALPEIYRTGALMLALVILGTVVQFYVDYHGHALGAMMETDMRQELFEHYQKLSFGFYDNQRTGQLMSRITNDLLSLAELYHHAPEDIMINTVKFVGGFAILLWINVPLTLIVFGFLAALAVFSVYFNRRMHRAYKASYQRMAEVNAQVEDSLAGIRVVHSFANEKAEIDKFARENRRFLESRKHIYRSEAYYWQGTVTFTQLITAAVVVFGGAAIVRQTLDLADLLVFLLYTSSLIEPIRGFLHTAAQYQEGVTGFERFMDIIETQPEVPRVDQGITLEHVRGDVQFKNVGFRYQDGHAFVLKDISLDVNAGETIALVGSSGVGKTTLCSLIPRFYEVSEGQILLDGVDIKEINLHALRRNVGVVQQDVYLFAGTVYENILYGKPEASRAEVIAAAQKANAHEFITALPNGYDTDIGQRGVKLSGGQKQRLSIARVFLKNPPVLIFDEATSALDSDSERVVQDSLEILAKDRTTFVIAHRLSTIRSAGRIVVLTDRGIEEQGTHNDLMAKEGTYAHLYTMQFHSSFSKSAA